MATPISVIINAFLKRIEKDRDFFRLINLTESDSKDLALRRSNNYLDEAVSILSLRGCNHISFTDIDTSLGMFNSDLTREEIYLIASVMYEIHLDRDISKIKILSVNYTPTELRVFDPSNARSTFLALYENVQNNNDRLINEYINRDRRTGKLIGIDYAEYNDEE